ncbi:sulfotransferase family protein [Gluconobacter frateurii]|nr:sulfotransferase family protein [Gluconobacter frateurii]UMM09083.1 sulfotransferase family protein [Gluconobacter frateurii]
MDPLWQDAWRAILPYLSPNDRILLPEGNWPTANVAEVRTYHYVIDIDDATVLILYKARMAGIPHDVLKKIYTTWKPIFANEVFACFKHYGFRRILDPVMRRAKHYRVIKEALYSRKLRRCRDTLFFVHIPKTAGTTVWEAIGERTPSKLYYESYESIVCSPPKCKNFDLIGGHVSLPLFAALAASNDCIAAVLRDPLARFRSAFLHSRRVNEDPQTFTDTMRFMRDNSLRDFLTYPDAVMEICQQTVMLGFDFNSPYDSSMEQGIFEQARAAVEQPKNLFATTCQLESFIGAMRTKLKLPLLDKPLPIRNASNHISQKQDIEEFEDSISKIREILHMDQDLYNIVRRKSEKYFA